MIKNCTPHPLHLYEEGGYVRVIPPELEPARCEVEREHLGEVDGVPVARLRFGNVQGLPDPEPGVWYVVSVVTAKAALDRTDLLVTDEAVRDSGGRIIGCRGFSVVNGGVL